MTEQEKAAREKELSDWLETYTGPITTGPIRTAREAEVDSFMDFLIHGKAFFLEDQEGSITSVAAKYVNDINVEDTSTVNKQ